MLHCRATAVYDLVKLLVKCSLYLAGFWPRHAEHSGPKKREMSSYSLYGETTFKMMLTPFCASSVSTGLVSGRVLQEAGGVRRCNQTRSLLLTAFQALSSAISTTAP